MPFWAVLGAALFVFIGVLAVRYFSRPAMRPRQISEMTRAHTTQKCDTCYGNGVIDSTNPTKNLSIYDQMKTANQTDCGCCGGTGFHIMVKGTRRVCKVYAGN